MFEVHLIEDVSKQKQSNVVSTFYIKIDFST